MTYSKLFHPWATGETAYESQRDPIERQRPMSTAIRALDDHQLRVLLIALLQEWRGRTALRGDKV